MPSASELYTAVDHYLEAALLPPDAALVAALEASERAGLPPIQVAPTHGKLLHLLAKIQGAKKILEIGTLGGYSTIWLARALPAGGRVVTLEALEKHADVARRNFLTAGVAAVVEVRVGPAKETLPLLERENAGPFDFFFIDADKASIPLYVSWALRLGRPGSVVVVDNVVRAGAVLSEESADPNVLGVRRMNELLATEPRFEATSIQTVGVKGHDGFMIARML